jgi:hypothetical protein
MKEEEMMKNGYLTSEENANILEAIIKRHKQRLDEKRRVERIP